MQVSLGARISELGQAWRVLGIEQRVAAAGSLLLIASTIGSNFTFVEAAEIVTALGVLLLLKRRADGYEFHLPFGDGTAIAAAGAWCGLLIVVRLFDRPLGQSVLALACAALILGAGLRERAKRPMDDLPEETLKIPRDVMEREEEPPPRSRRDRAQPEDRAERVRPDQERTERLSPDQERTERISGARDRPPSGLGSAPDPEPPPEWRPPPRRPR